MNTLGNHNFTDTDLIEGCIKGERKIQQALYEKFAPKMFGVCLRYAGHTGEAEDILQEGFIKVYTKISSYRKEGSFEGWVRRIFVNTAIEHFRKKTFLQPITQENESTEDNYLSVLDTLAEKDIIELIQKLSPGYRTVFNMYVIEGYTHRQIGEALGISEGTSKSQLSRAKQILQELVKSFLDLQNKMPIHE
ncbi:MAG: sigma-70 family RNA polymerase sigma factor [Flavisolibacter sp.]